MNIKFTCEFISRSVAKINGVVDHLQARMHFLTFFLCCDAWSRCVDTFNVLVCGLTLHANHLQVDQSAPNSSPRVGSSEGTLGEGESVNDCTALIRVILQSH